MLAIFETHPVQYHAPVWRAVSCGGVPVKVFYGDDFSVRGYSDPGFGEVFSWDVDLLEGYYSEILSNGQRFKPSDKSEVTTRRISAVFEEHEPKAVLVLGYSHRFERAVIRESFKRNLPVIYRGEANDSASERSLPKKIIRDLYLRRLYRRLAAILYIGSEAKAHYKRLGVTNDRLRFSPYCAGELGFDNKSGSIQRRNFLRRELSIADDATVIMYSGKLSYRKGVDLLLDAFLNLRKRNLILLYVGSGRLQMMLKSKAGLEAVRFVGFKNQSALGKYYESSDILVLPSRYGETWGLVVNEGLRYGLPVVVSDTVGCRHDLVVPGETGEMFRNDCQKDLESALLRATVYAKRKGISEACRRRVSAYSVSNAAKGVEGAYRSVIQNIL